MKIIFQDVNLAIIERDNNELTVMAKNYMGVDEKTAEDAIKTVFGENKGFYLNNILRYGIDNNVFVYIDSDGEKIMINDAEVINELELETIYILKNNPSWLNSSNLTNEEKNIILAKTKALA